MILLLLASATPDRRLRREVVGRAEVQVELLLDVTDGHRAHGLIELGNLRLTATVL